jgi:hypothetical protein
MSNVAALPPRHVLGVVRGRIRLPCQLSFGPLTVCLCPPDESIRPSNYYLSLLNRQLSARPTHPL